MNGPQIASSRHKSRAGAALDIGRFATAEAEAKAALAIDPRDVESNLYLARALLGQGRYAESAEAARTTVGFAPRDGYAHYLLGFALQAGGRAKEAAVALREAVALSPHSARFHARLAIALLESGEREAAHAAIEAALALDADNALLLDEAARVYALLRDTALAEQLARKVVVMTPDSATAHWRLAWVLGQQKRYADACTAATAALAIDPNNWAAWEELGYDYYQLGEFEDAEWALRETLRLKPGLSTAAWNLANALLRLDEPAQAATVCRDALAANPDDKRARDLLAQLEASAREREQHRRWQRFSLIARLLVVAWALVRSREPVVIGIEVVAGVIFAVMLARTYLPARSRRRGGRSHDRLQRANKGSGDAGPA